MNDLLKIIWGIVALLLLGILYVRAADIEMPLRKTEIAPAEAAELTGYTGCIDSAYRIAHIVCVVDGTVSHCTSIGKRKGSVSTSTGTQEETEEQTAEEKALAIFVPYEFHMKVKKECDGLGDRDLYLRCYADHSFEFGYYYDVLMTLSYPDKNTIEDIELSDEALSYMYKMFPIPTEYESEIISIAEQRLAEIRASYEKNQ